MKQRDYSKLMAELAEEYTKHSPQSAALHKEAVQYLIDGGSHGLRLMQPFSPRIVKSNGGWVTDEDGHNILDFWQGHYANILGHNPEFVTSELSRAFSEGFGLQSGFADRLQIETAKLICERTGAERVRFTCSGGLATMYSIMLSRTFTGRDRVLKVGGGWHGGHFWGLKGVGFHDGFDVVDSAGIPSAVTDEVYITGYNNPELLSDYFKKYGDKTACFIVEPVIGTGGLMPATMEYMQTARELTQKYGTVLIHDEVISGFRFHAGNTGALYNVQPDLMTLGKAVGGGMPVAVVAGRADILGLAGSERQSTVKFSGGTYSAHPSSLLAAKTFVNYLVENEKVIYPHLLKMGSLIRQTIKKAFTDEGIYVRIAGDENNVLGGNSLVMILFPYKEGLKLITPEEVLNPEVCDITLGEKVMQRALMVEDVFTAHGLGCATAAHTPDDVRFLGEACANIARRIKPYM